MQTFLHVGGVPSLGVKLWESRREALDVEVGDIDLGFCPSCGNICNLAFEPALVDYDGDYENSLHVSARFQDYADGLADRLIAAHDLHGKDIVEVGCGQGDFLRQLCELGPNRGVGFDPAYRGPESVAAGPASLRFVRELYAPEHADVAVDFVMARHLLEHLEDPTAFLRQIRETIGDRSARIYVEVPSAEFVLRDSVWSLLYEHPYYFSPPSLSHVVDRTGFEVLDVRTAFDDQFLSIEAAASASDGGPSEIDAGAVDRIGKLAFAFAEQYERELDRWGEQLAQWRTRGANVVAWGAGAKGSTFVTLVPNADAVSALVDVNPLKHGRHVPGTGHPVLAPEDLTDRPPDVVLVMNPVYEDEIRSMLGTLGVESHLTCL